MKREQQCEQSPLAQHFTLRALLRFALPTILMMIAMGLYTLGDTLIIARFIHTNALSALNIVTPVINIIVGLGTMLASGGSAVVARKMGEGRATRARQDFTWIVLAGVVIGAGVALLGSLLVDRIIWGLGASRLLFPYCKAYLGLLLLFTPASILQVLMQNLIVTAGRPGLGLVISLGAGAANVLLDYVFVVIMDMGIAGAALGTGVGYLIPTVLGLGFFARPKGTLHFQRPVPDFGVLWESVSNGFSELVSQMAAAVSTLMFNLLMMRLLGEDGVAAITIIIYAQFLLTALYIGFSMGVAPVISFHFGRQDASELRRLLGMCLRFIGAASVAVLLLTLLGGDWLVANFCAADTAVYQIASLGLRIFAMSFLFSGFNIFASAAFTALSNGRVSAVISTLRTFVFLIAALLLLPRYWGVTGIWLAVPLAELLTSLMALALALRYAKAYGLR